MYMKKVEEKTETLTDTYLNEKIEFINFMVSVCQSKKLQKHYNLLIKCALFTKKRTE